jgi:hypothetical protein
MEYVRNAYRIAAGKLKGKMSLGESRCKIDDVIILKRILNKKNVDCILLAQGTAQWFVLVHTAVNFGVLKIKLIY